MDFSLDDTQTALKDLARSIFTEHATHDRLKELEAGGEWFDSRLWKALDDAGLTRIGVEEGGLLEQCVVLIEQGRTTAPVPLWSHLVAGLEGEGINTVALDGEATTQDGKLRGEKAGVPAMDVASRILVSAGEELHVTESPSFTATRRLTTAGFPEFIVMFNDAPAERIDGEAADLHRRAKIATSALAVGVAERALEITASYVSERKQFGAPLGSLQAVQQRAADAYIDVEVMRNSMWQAAWRASEGLPADRETDIARFWTSEGVQRVVSAAQHLHGGMGSDVDYPLHRYTLWAKHLELCFGGATQTLDQMGARL
jgi:3-oxocholest-4-en-26-oyl-CoA dehydrogenase beta subunit